jgi:4-hydroxy-3-methylbut-2-enyl diphosphate reductase
MHVFLAKNSGFCFGVRRAVEMAEACARERSRVFTYGQIIHNEGVVSELEKKGVHPVEDVSALDRGDTLIIRAHGAPPAVYETAKTGGVHIVDATCPFVKRIHKIVKKATGEGRTVFIAGKTHHPEVVGICGWAGEHALVLEGPEDVGRVGYTHLAALVAQTTLPEETYADIRAVLGRRCGDLQVFGTICDTTRARQSEAVQIAKRSSRMYVLGSKMSANTQKLFELCKKHCVFIENIESIDKLFLDKLPSDDIIGIVAGASTPDWMIREVLQVMSEQEKTTIETIEAEAPAEDVVVSQEPQMTEDTPVAETIAETAGTEAPEAVEKDAVEAKDESNEVEKEVEPALAENAETEAVDAKEAEAEEAKPEKTPEHEESSEFAKAFEKTMTRIHNGQVITGTVISIVDGEVFVNIGYKSDGVVPAGEFSGDPDEKPEELFHEGDEIEVEVMRVNDGEGNVLLSRKNAQSKKLWDEMMNQADIEEKVFDAVGKEVVKGGIIADISGIRAFVPASHVSIKYIENLGEFVGKPMRLKVLEVDRQRKRIVASQKQVLLAEAAAERRKKWESLVVGEKIQGIVRRIADFGAFVDIGGIDGLVHVTDAAWGRVKHPSDVFSIGQEIEVLILNVDVEKERVSLGYKQLQPKPWTLAGEKYPVGSIVEGKVVRIVPFGAFVALESTIDGLIHISQVAPHRIAKVEDELKVGDVVRCKVLEVNPEAKRISLSRKEAILEDDPDLAERLKAEKAERDRQYAERQEQRAQQRGQAQQRANSSREASTRSAERSFSNGDRRDSSRYDRRRRNEDGDYELPPVQETTTSLASLFEGLKVEDDDK